MDKNFIATGLTFVFFPEEQQNIKNISEILDSTTISSPNIPVHTIESDSTAYKDAKRMEEEEEHPEWRSGGGKQNF